MQERRESDGQTRDRLTKLEVKFDNHEKKMDSVVATQSEMNTKLDALLILNAEVRGAGKLAKVMWTAAAGAAGFVGGLIGSVPKHM